MKYNSKNLETQCVRAGVDKYEFGPVVPPIFQTSTFKFNDAKHGASLFAGEEKGYIYSRMGNPTIEALENALAELEGGTNALCCSSGMAAINTVLSAFLSSGDHIVCSKAVYAPTSTLLSTVYSKFGIKTTFVDSSSLNEVKNAAKGDVKMIYVESPGNPTLAISDLKAISEIAKDKNALFVVDNTFMGPVLQRPFEFGADIIVHSMTKSLNGHADVVAGAIIVKNEYLYSELRKILNQTGGVIDPFNAFLTHRGIKTLQLRVERVSQNALKIAEALETHPKVEWVRYPFLKSHPQYELAKKQCKHGGQMISFELKGGYEAGEKLMNNVKLCILAVSLGGVETLIQHPASMTHFSMGKEARKAAGITEGLIRLSVGIEHYEDILNDILQALEKV